MSGQLVQLLYVSSAADRVSGADVDQILSASRRNNLPIAVTGMLLLCDGNFMQVLEGLPETVDQTFERISRDDRHKGLNTLLRSSIAERTFADWSMGFETIDPNSSIDAAAAFEIGRNAVAGRMPGMAARELLVFMQNFYSINTRKSLDLLSRA